MSQADLDALRSTLLALPAGDVDSPDLPVAVVLQEAHDLRTLCADAKVRERLVSVGLQSTALDALAIAEGALRVAQSEWVVSRDRSKDEAQKAREARGMELRAELAAAVRWNLRAERKALAVLSVIQEGEGVADLVQDLDDLAMLIVQYLPAFASDQSFDAPARAEEARTLGAEIRAGLSQTRQPGAQEASKDLRDRAFSYLDDLKTRVRESARYAYRKEPAFSARFASAYKRRLRRRAPNTPDAPPAGPTA
jgi:hypothetical protein